MKSKLKIIQSIAVVTFFLSSSIILAETSSDLQTVVKGNSNFGFDLYQNLKGEEGNLFFSPYSISTALAMTYAGARGQTEKEMAKVLHFSLEQDSLHFSLSKLQSHLNTIQNKGHIKLSIANSLWAQENYLFLDTFFDLNKKYYGAGLNFVDFEKETEAARIAINTWVEKETQQKIKELIKRGMIDPLTTLVLCNAIYFKGNWFSQFDKERTADADFYIAPVKTIKIPMMSKKSEFKFKDFGNFSAIELPYEGNDLSMIVFLPKEIDGLVEFERNLTNDNVTIWTDKLIASYKSEVLVDLPEFQTTCEFELSKIFSGMGMPSAFSLPPADFFGMTGRKNLFISKVIHKAFIDVNEEGTEAAAATAVVMQRLAISRPLTFRANHPFVFLIRESRTGSILFIGRILDPTK